MGTIRGGMLRAVLLGILVGMMGFFLVGCGEKDVSQIDSNEFYGSDETYAVPESVGPTELPMVVGPSTPSPSY